MEIEKGTPIRVILPNGNIEGVFNGYFKGNSVRFITIAYKGKILMFPETHCTMEVIEL